MSTYKLLYDSLLKKVDSGVVLSEYELCGLSSSDIARLERKMAGLDACELSNVECRDDVKLNAIDLQWVTSRMSGELCVYIVIPDCWLWQENTLIELDNYDVSCICIGECYSPYDFKPVEYVPTKEDLVIGQDAINSFVEYGVL